MGVNLCTAIKTIVSLALLIFSIVMVMALIWHRETKISHDVHPALAYVVIWVSIIWLSMVEGSQGSLVGLAPIQKDLYEQSHPMTYKCASVAHRGNNLDRFLVGRQFLVVLLIFVTTLAGAPRDDGAKVFRLPEIIIKMFLESGVANILMTTNIGQLASQVNVSRSMLDYINSCFAIFTVYAALAMEFTGLFHAVYLVQTILTWFKGNSSLVSKEPPLTACQSLFFWGRVLMSLTVLGFCFAVTIKALLEGETTMWPGVPKWASILLFFLLMCIVGILEGMQVAFYGVSKLSQEEADYLNYNVVAGKAALFYGKEGENLPKFMIGRQILVTMCFFCLARITTVKVNVWDENHDNIFGVRNPFQKFFNTGLLGAVLTTIAGSISWQLAASSFPVAFLSNPLVSILLRICLLLEATGVCSAAWLLAWIQKKVAGFKTDDIYIGNAEQRASRKLSDIDEEAQPMAGRLYPGVPTYPTQIGTH